MENSKIQWTDATFNPWIGCAKVSAGCKNCYAENLMDTRYGKVEWGVNGTRVRTSVDYWKQPLKWNRRAQLSGIRERVFCASLADVFEQRNDLVVWRAELFKLIRSTPYLDWLLLTKRPEYIDTGLYESLVIAQDNAEGSDPSNDSGWLNTAEWLSNWLMGSHIPPNVWIGTSVENQEQADIRIPLLLDVPAAIRFLSMEPLLGGVDLWQYDDFDRCLKGIGIIEKVGVSASTPDFPPQGYDASYPGIDWVIVGGESGAGARPMHPDWVRALRDQCQAAGVPFFFKQWGSWLPWEPDVQPPFWNSQAGHFVDGHGLHILDPETSEASKGWDDGMWGIAENLSDCSFQNVGKHAAGRKLDGKSYDEFPATALTDAG